MSTQASPRTLITIKRPVPIKETPDSPDYYEQTFELDTLKGSLDTWMREELDRYKILTRKRVEQALENVLSNWQ